MKSYMYKFITVFLNCNTLILRATGHFIGTSEFKEIEYVSWLPYKPSIKSLQWHLLQVSVSNITVKWLKHPSMLKKEPWYCTWLLACVFKSLYRSVSIKHCTIYTSFMWSMVTARRMSLISIICIKEKNK